MLILLWQTEFVHHMLVGGRNYGITPEVFGCGVDASFTPMESAPMS